ncbi:PQQ-binding-like beta-propeller repeat protein [Thermosipho ferrireducens]|uniref:PQQ-binding-like beta-propeller repeat protein n=1 Tax=Thermosipho ferrireducens TaxID=2571116 RepID=A0ABX7S859_9BACT|nr:PQQ-binding-like beta-propeller repeat protein [Thermosipho ferrireducens]QTA38771.1 PQQ-binding-like beta-propeller repeat protein [Thermosipho ferrireducens]
MKNLKIIKLVFLILTVASIGFSQVFLLTPEGVYKSFEMIKTGNFNGMFIYDNFVYLLKNDGVVNLTTGKELYLENPEYIGSGFILSQNRLYRLKENQLDFIRILPDDLKDVFAFKDVIFGIQLGNIVAYENGKIIWSMSPETGKIEKIRLSKNYMAIFSNIDTTIFDLSDPRYPKYVQTFRKSDDYVFNGSHVLYHQKKVYFYDSEKKLIFSTTVPVDGKLLTDGENVYIGKIIITKDFNITNYPFKVLGAVVLNETHLEIPAFNELWSFSIDSDITGRPAVYNGTVYFATTNGIVFAVENGKELWRYRLPFIVTGHVTVDGNNVYVASWDDNIYSLSLSGKLLWKTKLDSDVTLGLAWDGMMLYALSDNGTLYEIKDGKVLKILKTGKWPLAGPFISLSGKIYVIDGMGYLWINDKKDRFVGKIKNVAFISENAIIPEENTFVLLDDFGNKFYIMKNILYRNDKKIFETDEELVDFVLGKKNIYILTGSGTLLILNKKEYKIINKKTFPETKFIILEGGTLFLIGKKITAVLVNDNPLNSWSSIYGNSWNSSAILF